MNWTDSLPESVRRDIRDAGRGHLLGDRPSLAERADDARTAQKESTLMNTDKAEILGKPAPAAENTGVTSGVREDLPQQADQTIAPDAQVQNTGDDDLTADDQGDDSANGDEEGPTDPFEA